MNAQSDYEKYLLQQQAERKPGINDMTLDERMTEYIEWQNTNFDRDLIIDAHLEIIKLRKFFETMRNALATYAEKGNWTLEATSHYLTGEVNANGYEEEKELSILLDDDYVWSYDGSPGWELASKVLQKVG